MQPSAAALTAIRKALHLTQEQMAARLGLSKRGYSGLESGDSPVREIHVLAAERVALAVAVETESPMAAPGPVRGQALALARLLAGEA